MRRRLAIAAALPHADLLQTLALRLAPHPADAADIVQDTYLRAFAAWQQRRPDDVGAWLATICLNAGRDERHRHARRNAALWDGPVPDLPGRADTADAALERLGTAPHQGGAVDPARQPADRDHPDGPARVHRHPGRRHHRRPALDRPGPRAPRPQDARPQPGRPAPARQATRSAAMGHDPGQLAAAYLTTMRPRARRRFEAHLLACEPCWQEICLARRSRQLAETARDLAPPGLRDDIRAAVTTAATLAASPPASPRAGHGHGPHGGGGARRHHHPGPATTPHPGPAPGAAPPAVIAAAVASYRAARLPGTAVPAEPAPTLPLTLGLAGAARGQLGGVAVTMFAYRAPSGERLTILVASRPFPEPGHARELGGAEGAWTMQSSGITNICAQHTHAMLLLGSDPVLIRRAGTLLNAI